MNLSPWPADVPYRPFRQPFRLEARYAPSIRTEMEDGPVRQRRTSTARWARLAYQILMTGAQYEAADAFVTQTLADGTARFTMPVGRPYTPDPWPQKVCYLDAGSWQATVAPGSRMFVTFTLNVLDW